MTTRKTQVSLGRLERSADRRCAQPAVGTHLKMLTGRQCQHSASHLLARCRATRPYSQRAQPHTSRNARLPKQKPQTPKRSCCLEAVSTEALNRALTEGADWEEPAEGFSSIPEALTDIAAGKFVVVLDDEGRENEGDLIIAAEHMTTEAMAFMVEHTSGVICVPLEGRDLDRLQIPLMVNSAENEELLYTAFTVTVDARHGTTTGISASDRTATCQALASRSSQPGDFKKPGHIFPLRYRQGGVLNRPGHTEAAVDLARLANCTPVGVLCEIVSKADGSMARTPELLDFALQHGLKCITIADLVAFRLKHETLVQSVADSRIQTRHGSFMVHCYRSLLDGSEHLALVCGNIAGKSDVLAAVHVGNTLDDAFGMHDSQTDHLLEAISTSREGVLIYMRAEGKSKDVPWSEQILQSSMDRPSVEASPSPVQQGIAAGIIKDLGINSIRVLSDIDSLPSSLNGSGLSVSDTLQASDVFKVSGSNGHAVASSSSSDASSDSSSDNSVQESLDAWLPQASKNSFR